MYRYLLHVRIYGFIKGLEVVDVNSPRFHHVVFGGRMVGGCTVNVVMLW